MTNYNLNLNIDHKDYYYRISKNSRNHLVQQKVNRPLEQKNDVIRLSNNVPYHMLDDVSPVVVDDSLEQTQTENLKDAMTKVLSLLTPREERVIRLRFGINLETDYTLKETGDMLNVNPERIRQIEAKALRKLKHPSRVRILKEFLTQSL